MTTNTSDKNSADTQGPKSDAKPPKVKKPKGPIRFEAIIPFCILVGLIWAYFFFFFDTHLRRGIEYAGTQANGAEVNVGSVRTSFWSASLAIEKIQVTDLDEPTKNKIQIGQIRWKMLWDALLRGKVAIEDASILEIAVGAPRSRPGRVLPKDPPGSQSAFDKVRESALKKAEQEFSKNVLGDLASILGGVDPAEQLKNIEGQLKSSALVKELEAGLKTKEKEWKARLDALPQKKDIDGLQARLKAVKVDGFNSPMEVQTSIKEIDAIFKEADAKAKAVQATRDALGTDVGGYQTSLKSLEDSVRQDIKDLENRIKLPTLDVKSLSTSLFGNMFLTRVKQAEFYMNKARTYMPPKKTAEEKAAYKAPTPQERAKGRNYKFGRPNSYPLFWLAKAQISSKVTPGAEWSGNLVGTLKDVTDDPPTLGRPTSASFQGDFPNQELYGIDGTVTVDHTTDKPVEKLNLKIGGFPISGQRLVDSEEVKLGFDSAQGTSDLNVELRGGEIKIASNSTFQMAKPKPGTSGSATANGAQVAPGSPASQGTVDQNGTPTTLSQSGRTSFLFADAKQPILSEILKATVASIPKVTLVASVAGPWSDLSFNIDSNLGRELAGSFEKQVQAKINEARAKLKAMVDEQVGKEKEKLMAEFNKAKGQVDNVVKEKEAELNKFKAQLEQAKNDAIKNQTKKLEGEGQKALDQLKNKFKF